MKRPYLLTLVAGAAIGFAVKSDIGARICCQRSYHFVWAASSDHGLYMRCLLCKTELELRTGGIDDSASD